MYGFACGCASLRVFACFCVSLRVFACFCGVQIFDLLPLRARQMSVHGPSWAEATTAAAVAAVSEARLRATTQATAQATAQASVEDGCSIGVAQRTGSIELALRFAQQLASIARPIEQPNTLPIETLAEGEISDDGLQLHATTAYRSKVRGVSKDARSDAGMKDGDTDGNKEGEGNREAEAKGNALTKVRSRGVGKDKGKDKNKSKGKGGEERVGNKHKEALKGDGALDGAHEYGEASNRKAARDVLDGFRIALQQLSSQVATVALASMGATHDVRRLMHTSKQAAAVSEKQVELQMDGVRVAQNQLASDIERMTRVLERCQGGVKSVASIPARIDQLAATLHGQVDALNVVMTGYYPLFAKLVQAHSGSHAGALAGAHAGSHAGGAGIARARAYLAAPASVLGGALATTSSGQAAESEDKATRKRPRKKSALALAVGGVSGVALVSGVGGEAGEAGAALSASSTGTAGNTGANYAAANAASVGVGFAFNATDFAATAGNAGANTAVNTAGNAGGNAGPNAVATTNTTRRTTAASQKKLEAYEACATSAQTAAAAATHAASQAVDASQTSRSALSAAADAVRALADVKHELAALRESLRASGHGAATLHTSAALQTSAAALQASAVRSTTTTTPTTSAAPRTTSVPQTTATMPTMDCRERVAACASFAGPRGFSKDAGLALLSELATEGWLCVVCRGAITGTAIVEGALGTLEGAFGTLEGAFGKQRVPASSSAAAASSAGAGSSRDLVHCAVVLEDVFCGVFCGASGQQQGQQRGQHQSQVASSGRPACARTTRALLKAVFLTNVSVWWYCEACWHVVEKQRKV